MSNDYRRAERAERAIHSFRDELHREAGEPKHKVPDTPAVQRAIVELHDAVGRNP